MSDTSDDHLLRRARTGDKEAVGELLLRHGPAIGQRLDINKKWQSILESKDVMQVTYFEAFEQIARFDGDARAFPNWLRRIAENNLRDAIQGLERAKRPQPEKRVAGGPNAKDDPVGLYELVTGDASPSRHAARNEARMILEAEIDTLPDAYRMVLRLVYLEDKSVADVALLIGRTKGAVHLLRIRAVDRLRNRLGSASRFLSYH